MHPKHNKFNALVTLLQEEGSLLTLPSYQNLFARLQGFIYGPNQNPSP